MRCIAGVDRAVGRVLDYLEANGLSENTLVIYTSDQGFYLGEHGWFDKRWMYEESFKMPFLIKSPGTIIPGTISDDKIMNIDFAPTLLDFAGLSIPEEMQGRSFKNTFTKNSDTKRNAVYYHYYEYPIWHNVQPHYGVRTDKYKLIHFYYSMDEWELYDMDADPHEMNNIYKNADPELISKLKFKLDSLKKYYGDTSSIKDMISMTDTVIQRVYNEPVKRNKIKTPIMNKYIFKIVITVFPFFTAYSQSDTVCNPSFEDSLNSWGLINNGSSVSTLSISSDSLYSGNLGLIYDVSYVNPPSSSCALTSCMLSLQQGYFYKISFWAKSDSSESLLVVLQPTSAPFTNYASGKTFVTSTNWQQYILYTSDSNAVSNLKIR